MAVCFNSGMGVKQDLERARELYERAAQGGFLYSLVNLGWLHLRADGGARGGAAEARKCWMRAKDAGSDVAAALLGELDAGRLVKDGGAASAGGSSGSAGSPQAASGQRTSSIPSMSSSSSSPGSSSGDSAASAQRMEYRPRFVDTKTTIADGGESGTIPNKQGGGCSVM
jgi:TPR repeat protein